MWQELLRSVMFLGCYCLFCVLVVIAMCSGEYSHTIYVDPESGNNSTTCLYSSSPTYPCRNLSYAFRYQNSSTQYLLQPGTHYLNGTVSFTDLHDIAITGNGSVGIVEIVCFANSGLSFINMENISFQSLHLIHCSSQQKSTNWNVYSPKFQLLYIRSAVYFSHCATISMYGVVISESADGANAVTVYNTVGTNIFTQCAFYNNTGLPAYVGGGGGVHIEFSYCLPGNTSCENGTEESYTDYNKHSVYSFTECIFSNNSAYLAPIIPFIPNRQYHLAFGRGGGLSLFFCGNATNNSIHVTNCTFWENTAESGAGLLVEFTDSSIGNHLIVTGTECNFMNNTCYSGGGMHVGHFLFNTTHKNFKGNLVDISSCKFSRNVATYGGGLQISASRQEMSRSQFFMVIISGLTFDSNEGRYGTALGFFLLDFILQFQYPDITITNCMFHYNKIYYDYSKPYEMGMGAVYVSELGVKFCGNNTFASNFGTALAVASATINITNSHMVFHNNLGLKGGAISLLESARLLISDNTSVLFVNNSAFIAGGAIYKEHSSQAEAKNCLVMHQDINLNPNEWRANFTFKDNFDVAYSSKNAIFSTSIQQCALTGTDTVFCWKQWVYSYDGVEDKNCSNYVRTAPGKITFADNTFYEQRPLVHAYPGEVIKLPIVVHDDLNHSLQTVFTADGRSDSGMLDSDYTYVWNNNIRVLGTGGGNFEMFLNSVEGRQWQVSISVSLTECPPGLIPTNAFETDSNSSNRRDKGQQWESSSYCVCTSQESFADLVQCNTATNSSLASGYWMGEWREADNRQFYVVATCPAGFCRTARTGFIPLPSTNLTEHICGVYKRKGRICGECIEGYGPALNSEVYSCVSCSLSKHQLAMNIIYYILAVYLPLFLLFLALIVFNIQLTTGPANAFILYSQVISSTMNLDASGTLFLKSITPNINILFKAYEFPYGIFNLKFFEHFVPPEHMCFGTHLNVLDVFHLDYLVAFFPLLMVIGITILYKIMDCCSVSSMISARFKRGPSARLRNALLPAFASFILLSYTKFSLTSSYILSFVTEHNASGHAVFPRRVNYAAQYAYSDKEYIVRYFLPAAFVFLTFVVIPPLVLLNYPLKLFETIIEQFPSVWRRYPYDKVHIMLDAFQGCYKNKWRCFAGLYFVFRLLINISNAFFDALKQFILQEVYCIAFALLVAYIKPYKKNYHLLNYVDSLIFLNLAIINLITLYLYADTRNGTNPSTFLFSVQYVLVFLPLLYMVSYMAWAVLPIRNKRRSRVRNWLLRQRQCQWMGSLIQSTTHEPMDDIDWTRAETTNCYTPPVNYSDQDSSLYRSLPTTGREIYNIRSSCATPLRNSRRGLLRRQSYGSPVILQASATDEG